MAAINWAEARRYLGLKADAPEWEDRLHRAGALVEEAAVPKGVWRRFPLSRSDAGLCFADMKAHSAALSSHLTDCDEVYLLAVTLGIGVDRLLERLTVTDVSLALMAQACAAALLESYCDELQAQMAEEAAKEGLFLRPRFSPGYGDLSLDLQPALLRALDAGKHIGLTVTGANMLAPTKSVTAIVGLSPKEGDCHALGCAACGKQNCQFRKEP